MDQLFNNGLIFIHDIGFFIKRIKIFKCNLYWKQKEWLHIPDSVGILMTPNYLVKYKNKLLYGLYIFLSKKECKVEINDDLGDESAIVFRTVLFVVF